MSEIIENVYEHENTKSFSLEKGLLEIRPIRRKGFQLILTENISQNILPR